VRKANYRIVENLEGEDLIIKDVGPWDRFPTVTNDAEAVVIELAGNGFLPEGRGLKYYDSEGEFDEIVVKNGKFVGFRPGGDY